HGDPATLKDPSAREAIRIKNAEELVELSRLSGQTNVVPEELTATLIDNKVTSLIAKSKRFKVAPPSRVEIQNLKEALLNAAMQPEAGGIRQAKNVSPELLAELDAASRGKL